MSTNTKGWLSSILKGGTSPPPAIPAPSGRSVAPPATAPAAALSPHSVAIPPPPLAPVETQATPQFEQPGEPPRVVLGVDATASRTRAVKAARNLMGSLLTVFPGGLEIALAVHGGGRVHTFTAFTDDVDKLRRVAGRIRCIAGRTALLDILETALGEDRCRIVVYIGDVFEESASKARRLAEALRLNETRVIILQDRAEFDISDDSDVFQTIAAITEGTVLPFEADAFDELGGMLEAVSVLAVGGTEMLEARQATMPAAPLLLQRLSDSKQLLIGRSGKP